MSDEQNSNTDAADGTPPEGEAKTFDAEYVDKLRKEAAKYRTEAKAGADARARLAEIEEANKTAEQKAAEKLAEIEKRASELAAREARTDVAAETGIPANILAGPTDSTPEAIKAFADLLAEHMGALRSNNNHSPREGETPKSGGDESREFARSLFARATD
jgi:hypothetical protein